MTVYYIYTSRIYVIQQNYYINVSIREYYTLDCARVRKDWCRFDQ